MEGLEDILSKDDVSALSEMSKNHHTGTIEFRDETYPSRSESIPVNVYFLSTAIRFKSIRCIQWLIDQKTSLDIQSNYMYPPLYNAICNGCGELDIVVLLLRAGAPCNVLATLSLWNNLPVHISMLILVGNTEDQKCLNV